jgi:Holliday junction DNA helicase RuvA
MYETISGKCSEIKSESMTITTHGIGYKIFVPKTALVDFSLLGKELTFYVSFVIRENLQALYGFLQREERDLFEILLDISGIGPKTALNLLSHLSFDDLSTALLKKEPALLSKVPGIGKKTAERLLIELKDKWKEIAHHAPQKTKSKLPLSSDAISALMNLGYSKDSASKAVEKAFLNHETDNLSNLITHALKYT